MIMDKASYEIRIKQWTGIIQEANASGMAKCSWCKQNGISLRQFYYWQKKVREWVLAQTASPSAVDPHNSPLLLDGKGNDRPVFCELPVPAGQGQPSDSSRHYTADTSFIPELVLQYDHFRLLVGSGVTEKTLSTVLSVLNHV